MSLRTRSSIPLSCAFVLALAACGSSSSDDSGTAGSHTSGNGGESSSGAGKAGSASEAGSASGGTRNGSAGSGTAASGSGTGGNENATAGTGTSTSGGSNGGAGGTDVLDPTLPKPSYDCRTDTASKTCISVSGTLNSMPIDLHCSLPDSPTVADGPPDAWLTGCRPSGMPGVGYFYLVSVPWQLPGTFDLVRTTNQTRAGADEILESDSTGVDFTTPNFVKGELAGTVVKDSTGMHTIVTGTFRGTWGTPGASCTGNAVNKCYAAQINGSFRSDQIVTFLDHP